MTNGSVPAKIVTWGQEYDTIYNDVVNLHHKRHIFRDTMAIIQKNPTLQAKGGRLLKTMPLLLLWGFDGKGNTETETLFQQVG